MFTGSVNISACATIEADADYITAFAHLPAGLGGSIIFRQQDNSPSADTFMYLDLYFVGEQKPTPLDWQINSGIVQMDIDAKTDLRDRCGSTIKDMYNPDSSTNTACSTTDHAGCIIGDMTAKHGQLIMNTSGKTRAFYGDLKLPLSGDNSIIGKTIAFKNGNQYFACANIVQFPKMSAISKFSDKNVTGTVSFTQRSPLDPVSINLDLVNLHSGAGGYHVHEWPVPQKISKNQQMCDNYNVGGHFNPFNIDTGAGYPDPATTTPEKYEVGDFSGKFGVLNNTADYKRNFTDPNVQLYGKNTIIGRSLVIYKDEEASPRWICATIWPGNDTPMNVAHATFTYPVIGHIVLRQPKGMWYAETQIYMELNYGTMSTVQTMNHNWHVHELPMGDDMLSAVNRCQSVKGHYNPYQVDLSGSYTSMCSAENQFRCELGDLSGKHGKLTIRANDGRSVKYFFSDMQLPLSGPQSIVGKSIVIHEANSGGARLSCADIMLKKELSVGVNKWNAAIDGGSPTGSITFTQNALDFLSGMTSVEVDLSGLNSEVETYHIHEFPTDIKASPQDVCQTSDVGGHVNPFQAEYPGPASGTQDLYEIGDLSGKFDDLTGNTYIAHRIDMTLPLEGPYSVVGRSIVIHSAAPNAPRWACGNLENTTPGSTLIEARAEFTGTVKGYVHMVS